jgi:hypothetical protein
MRFVNNARGDALKVTLRITTPGGRPQTVQLDMPPLGCEIRTLDIEHPTGEIVPGAL